MEDAKVPVVSAVGLTKEFRDFWGRPKARAVNDIDFEIRPGEVVGLLGPNGSGKSTTVKMILVSLRLKCGWVVNCAVDIVSMGITGLTPEHAKAKMSEYWELAYAGLQQLMKIPHGKMLFDIEEGDTLRGQCCDGGQTMRMNASFVNAEKANDLDEGRNTLLHEAFHALQFSAIDAFQNNILDKCGYYLVHFSIYATHAEQWRINFSRYRDSKKDFNLYEDQVVEAHARIFAANCLAEFEQFQREHPEIINEVNAMRL